MLWLKKTFVNWCLIIGLVLMPGVSSAGNGGVQQDVEQGSAEVMMVDIVAVRPLGLVATVFGAAVFLVASPFSAMGGNTRETWDSLVAEPARFTFQRPLGHFEDDADWFQQPLGHQGEGDNR